MTFIAIMGTLGLLVARVLGMGFVVLIYWPLYLGLAAIHLAVNLFAIRRFDRETRRIPRRVILSQILFLVGMLAQIEIGDGPVWFVGPAIFNVYFDLEHLSSRSSDIGLWNWVAFAPCVLSWVLLLVGAVKAR